MTDEQTPDTRTEEDEPLVGNDPDQDEVTAEDEPVETPEG